MPSPADHDVGSEPLYRRILQLTLQEAQAIAEEDWTALAGARRQKREEMARVEVGAAQTASQSPTDVQILEEIVECTQRNVTELERKRHAVRQELDAIPETRRNLSTVRGGYAKGAQPRAVCLDRRA